MDDSTLLSIKNFSEFTGVKRSTLKFYDDIGLLSPSIRGKENNYRYYTPMQSMTLSFINVLISLGVPLATVKTFIDERSPECIIELLSQQEVNLDRQLHELQTAYSIIHTFRRNIQSGLLAEDGDIRLEYLEETYYVLGPENDFSGTDTFYKPFMSFCDSAVEYRINLRYPIGGYHYDFETFLSAPGQPNKFFSQDPYGNCSRDAGQYLVGYKRGYYGNFGDLPQKMADYAAAHSFAFEGPVYVVYLLDEISIADPERYMARITVKISDCIKSKAPKRPDRAKTCPVFLSCIRPHCVHEQA